MTSIKHGGGGYEKYQYFTEKHTVYNQIAHYQLL